MRIIKLVIVSIISFDVLIGCSEENIAPVAILEVNSHFSYPGRMLTFSSTNSTDEDNDPLGLKRRWDFESDGIWDVPFTLNQKVNWFYPVPGWFVVTLEVTDYKGQTSFDRDTIFIFGPLDDSVMVDNRDSQAYRIVNIGTLWVMAENLRYGKMIHAPEPQTDNEEVEYYAYNNDEANVSRFGGLYSWWEAMDYNWASNEQGICPPKWRIPNRDDLEQIDFKASHYFIVDYYGSNGLSGLNIEFSGVYHEEPFNDYNEINPSSFSALGIFGFFWSSFYSINQVIGVGTYGKFGVSLPTYNQAYRGLGFDKTPFTYYKRPDGYFRNLYVSVRCVSSKI